MNKQCQACQQIFSCGENDGNPCWCMELPPIFEVPAIASNKEASISETISDCLCPACLLSKVKVLIAEKIDTSAAHQQAPAFALACRHQPPLEGLDYDVENGNWVFSRWYLLKQGKCCGNNCRNCPYGHINVAYR